MEQQDSSVPFTLAQQSRQRSRRTVRGIEPASAHHAREAAKHRAYSKAKAIVGVRAQTQQLARSGSEFAAKREQEAKVQASRERAQARKLKQANPALDLGNSSLRGVDVLRIPGSGPAQPDSQDVKLARVRAAVPSLSNAEARFYLSVEATVEGAVARAHADAAWERGRAATSRPAEASAWERGRGDWATAPEPDRGVEAAVASAEAFIRQAQEPALAVPVADAVVVEAVPVASHEPARSNISRQRDVSLL